MKKIAIFMFVILSSLSLFAMGTSEERPVVQSQSTKNESVQQSDRILIAYFSVPETDGVDTVSGASRVAFDGEVYGNNQYVAMLIQNEIGGDLFRIETENNYPGTHRALLEYAYNEKAENARPVLSGKLENLESYDIVFLAIQTGMQICRCLFIPSLRNMTFLARPLYLSRFMVVVDFQELLIQ